MTVDGHEVALGPGRRHWAAIIFLFSDAETAIVHAR